MREVLKIFQYIKTEDIKPRIHEKPIVDNSLVSGDKFRHGKESRKSYQWIDGLDLEELGNSIRLPRDTSWT